MQYLMTLYAALLFLVLVPGLFITIPRKGNKKVQVLVHALIFAVVYYLTENMVSKFLYEGFALPPLTPEQRKEARARIAAERARSMLASLQMSAEAKKNGLENGSPCKINRDCKSLNCGKHQILEGSRFVEILKCKA